MKEQASLIYLCNMKRFAVFRRSKRCSCGRDIALRHWVSVWPFDFGHHWKSQ